MAEPTDHELLARFARTGAEDAFGGLVTRHVNLVYSAARRFTSDDTLAEEITQAVFIILARKAGKIPARVVLTGWLYQTARLTAANALKEKIRRQQREHQAYMESTFNPPNADEAWQQLAPVLDDAMHALRTADRDAVLLRYFENKPLAEVGAALGVSEDAARVRVNRALDKLRSLLTKQGVTLGATAIARAVTANSVQAAPVAVGKTIITIAVAKGAMATASTLTLVKGALKLMSWMKAKTAIVAGIALLLAGGATTMVVKKFVDRPLISEELWVADSRILEKVPPVLIIRPTKFAGGGGAGLDAGDRAVWLNASINSLLSIAYGFPESRMILPNNISSKRYDLMLTLPNSPKEALKSEIKKRFDLIGHSQIVETNVLLLKVGNPNAPILVATHGKFVDLSSIKPLKHEHLMYCDRYGTTVSSFAQNIEFYLKEKIYDQTGLTTNRYAFVLRWQEKGGETEIDAFKRAVLEQLGLEFVPSREKVEMLVVEKVK